MAVAHADAMRWTALGTQLCERALASVDDDALADPSALPGWSRAHLVAHLDGNARALRNLVTWARTGVETPMYSSMAQRDADVATGAALPPRELRERFAQSRTALANGMARLSEQAWGAEVRTIQGRTVPASEIPWLRSREVMVHAVDLLGGVTFDDLPGDFLAALLDDVAARRSTLDSQPALVLEAAGRRWDVAGAGEPVVVAGSLADVASYGTGRAPLGPEQPAWL
jgi:maleylpyruvate isomerase